MNLWSNSLSFLSSFQTVHISTLFLQQEYLSHTHSLLKSYPCIKVLYKSCIHHDIFLNWSSVFWISSSFIAYSYSDRISWTIPMLYVTLFSNYRLLWIVIYFFQSASSVYLVRLYEFQIHTYYWMGRWFNQAIKLHFDYSPVQMVHMSLTYFGNECW